MFGCVLISREIESHLHQGLSDSAGHKTNVRNSRGVST